MGFEWITLNGSCAACLALEGYHDEEPERPHPNCDCDIFEVDENDPGACWAIINDDDSGLYVDGVVTFEVDVYKVCADGNEVHDFFLMEASFDEWYEAFIEEDNGKEWDEWHDELHDRMLAMCEQELEYECTTFSDPTP